MTLSQTPMINAINTGGFLLHHNTSPTEMVDRLLSLLNQYLVSNQNLQLNKTFKVYLKILSSNHSQIHSVETKRAKKQKVGCPNVNPLKALWAIDVPQIDFLRNCCLLLSTVLAIAQHEYFESNLSNQKFKYMEKILSSNTKKFKYAETLLIKAVTKIFDETVIPYHQEPYDLIETVTHLSQYFKCQFFIFEGSLKVTSKLFLRYPADYDCSLKPIFLYKINDHVIFIRNLSAYYHSNGQTCFVCKKFYRSPHYKHFCKDNNNCCFVCHRYFQKSTSYVTSNLEKYFCNSKLQNDLNEKCTLCNVYLNSLSCKKAHRKLCNSKGFFGYFCDLCKRFTYASSGTNSQTLKEKHNCSHRTCKICYNSCVGEHLCKLITPSYPKIHTKLCFLNLEVCANVPIACVLFLENDNQSKVYFENILLADTNLNLYQNFRPEPLIYQDLEKYTLCGRSLKLKKYSNDFSVTKNKVTKMNHSFVKKFLEFVLEDNLRGTTFIVADEENSSMVSWAEVILFQEMR